jgi:hypothetical protein
MVGPLEGSFASLCWEARLALSDASLAGTTQDEPLGPSQFRDAVRERILALATCTRSVLVFQDKLRELADVASRSPF